VTDKGKVCEWSDEGHIMADSKVKGWVQGGDRFEFCAAEGQAHEYGAKALRLVELIVGPGGSSNIDTEARSLLEIVAGY
jgi:hypothetical protein